MVSSRTCTRLVVYFTTKLELEREKHHLENAQRCESSFLSLAKSLASNNNNYGFDNRVDNRRTTLALTAVLMINGQPWL